MAAPLCTATAPSAPALSVPVSSTLKVVAVTYDGGGKTFTNSHTRDVPTICIGYAEGTCTSSTVKPF